MCELFLNSHIFHSIFRTFNFELSNSKCELFSILNKKRQRRQNFQIFKGPFFCNAQLSGYDFWRVFSDLCEASKMYSFPFFFKNIAKVITI